ncbi:MAG: FAD-dependent oxidoreductase [Cytophagales bacterium]|nr:FAD-dependent oxidoreductase [Cytophagales bacterium]
MKNLLILLSFASLMWSCQPAPQTDYDLVVYGGSSAGVIAAYSASQLGKKVVLISPDKHLGGLSSSGLGYTDIGNKYAVTGLALDFYRRLGLYYNRLEAWTFEPHKAEGVFNEYIKEGRVEVWYNSYLRQVEKEGTRIRSITVFDWESGEEKTVSGLQFIDASYVGDLMAQAGVSYTVGREANELYGETLNGVQLKDQHQFPPFEGKEDYGIDPYQIPGDSTSGLCYGISPEPLQPNGTGDKKVQAYNYRLCLTQDSANRVPFVQPPSYDPTKYELLRRLIAKREEQGWVQRIGQLYLKPDAMPRGKTDVNNKGPFSTDFIGMNYDYPEASHERRKEIEQEHKEYIQGLLYFLAHDERLPPSLRDEMNSWGWAKDEFLDTDHFPFKMYIREARRMVGELVMTEHHCRGDQVAPKPVGMAAYTMDSHNCQRVLIKEGGKVYVKNEGDVQVGGFPPYVIGYHSITPKREECTNLLVPVCLSATHIAYGSIRMEPVFMVLAQSAALAAAQAIDEGVAIQEIDYDKLRQRLENDPWLNGQSKEYVLDDTDLPATAWVGPWQSRTMHNQYKNSTHLLDSAGSGELMLNDLPTPEGLYKIYYYVPGKRTTGDWTAMKKVDWAGGLVLRWEQGGQRAETTISLDEVQSDWVLLGEYKLEADASLSFGPTQQAGYLPFDAILFQPVSSAP